MFKKLWPYMLGTAVLIAGTAISGKLAASHQPRRTASHPVSSAVLQPIRIEPAPEALYYLAAEVLVDKLKTGDIQLTVCEYHELVSQTSQHLQEDLGFELPQGYVIPQELAPECLQKPRFVGTDEYRCVEVLRRANQDYLDSAIRRILDLRAVQTIQLMVDRLTAIRMFRKAGDAESLSLVKGIYGENFVTDYAKAHAQIEPPTRQRKKVAGTNGGALPAGSVAEAEERISSLWRTEFTTPEIAELKDYILGAKLQTKLQDDLLCDNLGAAERELMAKTVIGYRLVALHDLTRKLVLAARRPSFHRP